MDDWIDGRLSNEERAEFALRLEVEPQLAEELALHTRIEGALGRLFPVPASVTLAPRPEPIAPPRPGGASVFPWPVLAAAGVAAALLLASLLGQRRPVLERSTELAGASDSTVAALLDCELPLPAVGPPTECIAMGPVRKQADLAALFEEFSNLSGFMSCSGPDELVAKLAAAYGCCTDLELRPEAAFMLQGPFTSDTWPTGTILTGQSSAGASVLVAELDRNLECCLDPSLAEDSDLNVYTWQFSDLVLTEITRNDEPQLLGYFSLN